MRRAAGYAKAVRGDRGVLLDKRAGNIPTEPQMGCHAYCFNHVMKFAGKRNVVHLENI